MMTNKDDTATTNFGADAIRVHFSEHQNRRMKMTILPRLPTDVFILKLV